MFAFASSTDQHTVCVYMCARARAYIYMCKHNYFVCKLGRDLYLTWTVLRCRVF